MKHETETLIFIRQFIDEYDNFPTIEIIADHFKLSMGGAVKRINTLIEKGHVVRLRNIRRYALARKMNKALP